MRNERKPPAPVQAPDPIRAEVMARYLLAAAEANDAPEEVVEALEALEEQLYDGPDEVAEGLGE